MALTNATYTKLMLEARKLVQDRNKAKIRIVEIATRVCDIQMGGHLNSGIYSIAKFARDIRMNNKTLNNWILEYQQVTSHLPPEIRENGDTYAIRSIMQDLKGGESSAKILKMYNSYHSVPKEERDLELMTKKLHTLLFFVRTHAVNIFNKERALKARRINFETLTQVMDLLSQIDEEYKIKGVE